MPTASAQARKRRVRVHDADRLPALTKREIARLRELPDGIATEDAPESDANSWLEAKPLNEAIPAWPIRPPGRPAAGSKASESMVVSLRLPKALSGAMRRRVKALHLIQRGNAERSRLLALLTAPSHLIPCSCPRTENRC